MPREIPPPLELQCLKALWQLGEANVKDVRRVLTSNRKLAYTTVMTVLDRLERRGGVRRRKIGRSFVYTPMLSRESLRRLALKEFVDSFFDGSTDSLKHYLEGAAPAHTEYPDVMEEAKLDASLL
jgi:BlaI family penicillinase repressor